MQIKKKENSSPNDEISKKRGKHKRKMKSKVRENGAPCISQAPSNETVASEAKTDKEHDNGIALANGANLANDNLLTVLDSANGIEMLKDAFLQVSVISSGMESLQLSDVSIKNTQPKLSPTANKFPIPRDECTQHLVCQSATSMSEVVPDKLSINQVPENVQDCCVTSSPAAISPDLEDFKANVSTCEMQNIAIDCVPQELQLVVQNVAEVVESPENGISGENGAVILTPEDCLNPIIKHDFAIPQHLCGLLIGKNGRFVNFIKRETNTDVVIVEHPVYRELKVCRLSGEQEEIDHALYIIRDRFPANEYPDVSLDHVNFAPTNNFVVQGNLRLTLRDEFQFDVVLSATVNAGHFFVQQPTHPLFPHLKSLVERMTCWYDNNSSPELADFKGGYICVARSATADGWFRVVVIDNSEDSLECVIEYVDLGGYATVPCRSLRQIRPEFLELPFQATECYLASVTPLNGQETWSPEATKAFINLAGGQILRCTLAGHSGNGLPYVNLFCMKDCRRIYINRELVMLGLAKWIEYCS